MRRLATIGRVGASVVLLAGSLMIGRLALPGRAFACYCAPPETVAAYRTDADVVIVAGTVRELGPARGQFAIEQVFKGAVAAAVLPIIVDTSSCGLFLKDGTRMVLAAHLENGALQPSVCMSAARIPSAEADSLIADAVAVFGGGQPPPGGADDLGEPNAPLAPTAQPAAPAPAAGTDDSMVVAAVLVGLAGAFTLLLFGGLAWLLRRRRVAP